MKLSTQRVAALAAAAALALAACGGDDDDAATTDAPAGDTTAPAPTDAPADETTAPTEAMTSEPMTSEPMTSEPGGTTPPAGTTGDLSGLEGSVFVSGSSTVEPISIAVGNAFADLAPSVAVTVEGPGTGDGFAKFCAGETDISDASRAIKDEEAETCAAAGIEFIELKVAVDGLSVVTSANNTNGVECLSSICTRCSARMPPASTTGPTPRRSPTSTPPP